jgi:ubiquinone/menaquinone biosynthesis C-methylase UbiE
MQGQNSHKKDIIEHFSKQTRYWKTVYDDQQGGMTTFRSMELKRRKETILKYIDEYAQGRVLKVLDCGCGSGGIMENLLKNGHKVFGLDISMDMIIEARKLSKQYAADESNCLRGDIEVLPFLTDTFDVVLSVGVLQFLEHDRIALQELSRIAKQDGIVLITLPNIIKLNNLFDPYYYVCRGTKYLAWKFGKTRKDSSKTPAPKDFGNNTDFSNRRYLYWQLAKELRFCNLRVVDTCAVGFGPMTLWHKEFLPLTWSMKISNCLERLAGMRGFVHINIFANQWMVCIEKSADEKRSFY